MISEEQLNQLCLQGESFYVDYKRAQYAFVGGTDDQKAELLKDVLCFANSFRKTPAYILIGVDEEPSGIGTVKWPACRFLHFPSCVAEGDMVELCRR